MLLYYRLVKYKCTKSCRKCLLTFISNKGNIKSVNISVKMLKFFWCKRMTPQQRQGNSKTQILSAGHILNWQYLPALPLGAWASPGHSFFHIHPLYSTYISRRGVLEPIPTVFGLEVGYHLSYQIANINIFLVKLFLCLLGSYVLVIFVLCWVWNSFLSRRRLKILGWNCSYFLPLHRNFAS